MNRQFQSYLKIFVIIMVLAFLTAFGFLRFHDSAAAQGEATNFKALLERMQHRRIEEPSLLLFFEFENPLFGDEKVWTIGDSRTTDEFIRRIVEIGDDYICFSEIRGVADLWFCTPFSNIVSVSFLNN